MIEPIIHTSGEEELPRPLGERAGVRGDSGITFFQDVPKAFKPKDGEQLVMPLYHSFGPEELSGYSPSIVEREKLINAAKRETP
jgi:hypothetical protein